MTPQLTALNPPPTPATPPRIVEIGPFVGATSVPAAAGLVFVSADGTWGRAAS